MNKKILVAIFLLMPVVCVILVGSANYLGICVPKMRVLSDEEKIEAAIALINEQKEISSGVEKYCKSGICKRIPYDNVDQFLKENPDSCTVSRPAKQDPDDPVRGFWSRVLGFYSGEISCGYKVYFYDDLGKKKSILVKRTGESTVLFVTNCAKVDI